MNLGTAVGYLELDTSKFQSGLKTAKSQFEGFTKSTNDAGGKLKNLGNSFKTVGSALTKSVTLPLAGLGGLASKSAIDFESAFAGVKKTVNATDKELSELEKGIRNMAKEMPPAATEIAGVAEAAGQLGIETPNILGFTETMVMLGDSTNMSAEEAATSLARLANITGMSQKDFDRLGSTVVSLGNSLATTESDITSMGLRLAGAGSQIGLSESQILSFAGALSSVGIEAEAGGSAFSKVMVDMQLATEKGGDKLKQFADVAGMTSGEFKKAFEEDASTAIMAFIEGLENCEERGMSAIGVLDDMEIREVRLRDALLRASGASDVFNDALKIGADAWSENTSLTKEAEQRYETLASKMEIMKNKLKDVGINIGSALMPHLEKLVTKIGEVADWFGSLDPAMQGVILGVAGFLAVIGPVLLVFGNLFTLIGNAVTGFGLLKTALVAFGTVFKGNLLASLISFNTTLHASIIPAITSFASMLSGVVLAAIKGVATFLSGTLIPILTTTAVTIGAVTIPVWAVIAVLAALVAAGVLVYKNWDTIKAKCIEIWQNSIKPVITNVTNAIKSVVTSAWNGIKTTISNVTNAIKSVVLSAFNGIVSSISSSLSKAFSIATSWWNKIKNIFSKPISAIVNIFKKEKSLVTPPVNDATTYTNSLNARENTVNDFASGMSARTYTMYKNSEIDFKMPTIKADKSNNDNNGNIEVNLNIDKFVNSSKEDINELMNRIAFELKKRKVSYGGV